MQWIAPSGERTLQNQTLEKRLWEAADPGFDANSGLTSAQCTSTPVLGLIFLGSRRRGLPSAARAVEKSTTSSRRGPSRIDDPGAYHAERAVHLTPNARYDHLLNLPGRRERRPEDKRSDGGHQRSATRSLPACCRAMYQIFSSRTAQGALLKKFPKFPRLLNTMPSEGSMNTSLWRVRPDRGPQGRRVFHAEQHRPPALVR